MKYAAKILGAAMAEPKKADLSKLSKLEPGQIVRTIDGSAFRVRSKIDGPDGFVFKLATLAGKPVQTPADFRPVGLAMARFASWLKWKLAYNHNFDMYVNSYIEQFNQQHPDTPLPVPVIGRDGKPMQWAKWFQSAIVPKLHVPQKGETGDELKDEAIHEMLFTSFGQRHILEQFAKKIKNLGDEAHKQDLSPQLRAFLISTFLYRVSEMREKLQRMHPVTGDEEYDLEYLHKKLRNTRDPGLKEELEREIERLTGYAGGSREVPMVQPSEEDEGAEVNILETPEHGVGEADFESIEAQRDIAKFREGFYKWLKGTQGKAANGYAFMFDLIWVLVSKGDEDFKRGDLEEVWKQKTGLSTGSFKEYYTNLPAMLEKYVALHNDELEGNIILDLMDVIRQERERRTKAERRKQKAQPATASLNLAASDEELPWLEEMAVDKKGAQKTADEYEDHVKRVDPNYQEEKDSYDFPKNWKEEETEETHDKKKKKTAKLVAGTELTPEMRKQVQDAFIYRWTLDNPRRADVYHCDKCDVANQPYVNEQSAEGHQHPTIPMISDDQWIQEHSFYFTNDGRLQARRHAQPAYLAQHNASRVASVAQKFAVEKAAWNPGEGQCRECGAPLNNAEGTLCGQCLAEGAEDRLDPFDKFSACHHIKTICRKCGNVQTCRCSTPKVSSFVDSCSNCKEAMLGHDFDNADGQAIRDETYPDTGFTMNEADTTEFKEPRVAGISDRYMTPQQMVQEFNRPGGQGDQLRSEEHFEKEEVPITTKMRRGLGDPAIPRKEGAGSNSGDDDVRGVGDLWHELFYGDRLQQISGKAMVDGMEKESAVAAPENWQCQNCGHEGMMTTSGKCEACGSEALVSTLPAKPEHARPGIGEHSTGRFPAEKTGQGSGNTTVTMQEQNVTTPSTQNKGEPMAVPDAIDQNPGPHSPNAPYLAPRTPNIQPRIVNVPSGTQAESLASSTASKQGSEDADWNDDIRPEDIDTHPGEEAEDEEQCPQCEGYNTEVAQTEEGNELYCHDCAAVTDMWFPGTRPDLESEKVQEPFHWHGPEPTKVKEQTIPGEEHSTTDDMDFHRFMKSIGASKRKIAVHYTPEGEELPADYNPADYDIDPFSVSSMSDQEKENYLLSHGWLKENEHHGATWWMGQQMWWKEGYEEEIPYQSTDDAMEKELDLQEAAAERLMKQGAAPVTVNPNVAQQEALHAQQTNQGVAGPPAAVAIMPGQGQQQGPEETTIGRHTVEPELPNANYHMQSSLAAAEEERLLKEAGLEES
jgi:hypothetical protein